MTTAKQAIAQVGQKILRRINFDLKSFDDEDRSFLAVASDDRTDRHGESINQAGWDYADFENNPVIPWSHMYEMPPVAKATEIGIEDGKLMFRPKFATKEEYPFADTIYKLYKGGYLRAFSVGFMPTDIDEENNRYEEQQLLEISSVTVPANPGALALAYKEGVIDEVERKDMISHLDDAKELLERGVVSGSPAAYSDENRSWDGGGARKRALAYCTDSNGNVSWSKYKQFFCWYDATAPDKAGSYKLPIADVIDGSPKSVWKGCAAAMSALLGGRGGTNIPDGDRKGVYNKLVSLYKKWGKEPPEFKSFTDLRVAVAAIKRQLDVLTAGIDTNAEGATVPDDKDKSNQKADTVEVPVADIEKLEQTLEDAADVLDGWTGKPDEPGDDKQNDEGEAKPADDEKSGGGASTEVDTDNLTEEQAEQIGRAVEDSLAKRAGKVD